MFMKRNYWFPVCWVLSSLAFWFSMPATSQSPSASNADFKAGIHELEIAQVWSGHPVGFALLTAGDQQYVAFYAADRKLTVAQRTLGQRDWRFTVLPTTLGWDSHNYVTMAFDRDGYLHLAGNMHAIPLIYFRSSRPGDASTLIRVPSMTGQDEQKVTYPVFLHNPEGDLIFEYRSGVSGAGDTIRNRYDERTKTWSRLTAEPLFHGGTARNAYPIPLVLGPDGWYHQVWIWRESPWCETNHEISYMKSRDLVHWENIAGKPLELPISLGNPDVVVDDVPLRGGAINGSQSIGFDLNGKLVIAYIKYDDNGITQLYFARWSDGAWHSVQASRWTYRWDFHGGGSIPMEVMPGPLKADHGELSIAIHHVSYGDVIWKVDPTTFQLVGGPQPQQTAKQAGGPYTTSASSPLIQHIANDQGKPQADGVSYKLSWSTLSANRDQPRPEGPPAPSTLRLIVSK
jgi:hypothetical protein